MKQRAYPIVIQLYIITWIAFDIFVGFHVDTIIFKLYAFIMFFVLLNSLTNSVGNSYLANYNDLFCILDMIEFSTLALMVFSIQIKNINLFWILSFIVQITYIPWNYIYIKSSVMSPNAIRRINLYQIIDSFSAGMSLLIFILHKMKWIPDGISLIGFVFWIYVLAIWAKDNFTIGNKLTLPGDRIYLYDVIDNVWRRVKSISVDKEGRIKDIKFGNDNTVPNPNAEYFMLPGLIDTHVHVDQDPYRAELQEELGFVQSESLSDIIYRNAQEAAKSGITTLCDMGGTGLLNYYTIKNLQKDNIANIVTTGCFFSKKYGHYMKHGGFVLNNEKDAKLYSNYLTKLGIKYIKIMLGNYEITEDELKNIIHNVCNCKNVGKVRSFERDEENNEHDNELIDIFLTHLRNINDHSNNDGSQNILHVENVQNYDKKIIEIIKRHYDGLESHKLEKRDIFEECLNEINCTSVYSVEELSRIVQIFSMENFVIFAHAYQEADVNIAIDAGIRCIEHVGDYSKELMDKMKYNSVIITSTFVAAEDGAVLTSDLDAISYGVTPEIMTQWYLDTSRVLPMLYDKDIDVSLGTDSGFYGTPSFSLTREIVSLVNDLDISIEEVLKSATVVAAKKLNLDNEIGRIYPKFYADFVLYESNFLEHPIEINQPSQVWIRGKKIYDRYNS